MAWVTSTSRASGAMPSITPRQTDGALEPTPKSVMKEMNGRSAMGGMLANRSTPRASAQLDRLEVGRQVRVEVHLAPDARGEGVGRIGIAVHHEDALGAAIAAVAAPGLREVGEPVVELVLVGVRREA